MDVPQNLGQRIVEAARLAVAAHLHASLDGVHQFRQRVVIGGAGPVSPAGAGDSRLPHRPSRAGFVTDDETPAPPPPAPGTRHRPRFDPAD